MKRPIKFRGRGIDGEIYFGDVYRAGKGVGIHVYSKGIFEVEKDSIAQLVGYDANGDEVYEGDILVGDEDIYYIARLESTEQNPDTAEYTFWTYPSKLKLQEAVK